MTHVESRQVLRQRLSLSRLVGFSKQLQDPSNTCVFALTVDGLLGNSFD